jgi:hypothetical protein
LISIDGSLGADGTTSIATVGMELLKRYVEAGSTVRRPDPQR